MMEELKKQIIKLLPAELNLKPEDLVTPPKPEMGDVALPCFELAKKLGKNPAEVAKEIEATCCHSRESGDPDKSRLDSRFRGNDRLVSKVEAVGPYVNFYFKACVLAETVLKNLVKQKNKLCQSRLGVVKKILLEYPSNNTHKEVHVGHLRNICLGNALINLLSSSGYKVIPVNYINDFGAHVAKCLWALEKFHAKEKPPADKQKWLGEIYAEASQYLLDHPEVKEEVYAWQKKMEAQDKSIWPLFKKTRAWSLAGFAKIFKELKVKHQAVFYEKDIKADGQKMVDVLLKKKIAQVGEGGAIIVDLQKYNLDIGLLRKSNGAGLYLTSDLGLAMAKNKKYKVDVSIHLTGTEQNFYFQQLFKILELAGFNYKMKHVSYGLINLPSGKMSSRAGNVVLYENLRNEMTAAAEVETEKRHKNWSRKQIQKVAQEIAFGAMKFGMLRVSPGQIITFDIHETLSFDGMTGPYLQYSVARINSILKKSQITNPKLQINSAKLLNGEVEKRIVLKLAGFSEVVKISALNYDPSQLAKYVYELAKLFSEFYEKTPVLQAETKELVSARLGLVGLVKQTLENGLKLLGIPVIKEM